MSVTRLAAAMTACGFKVRVWQDRRIYVEGYGQDICASIEPASSDAVSADGANISIASTWRSQHAGLRCKGVKHALLQDLFTAGLLSVSPPEDWRRVILDDRPEPARRIIALESDGEPITFWPPVA